MSEQKTDFVIEQKVWRVVACIIAIIVMLRVHTQSMAAGQPILSLLLFVGIVLVILSIQHPRRLVAWVLIYYCFDPIMTSVKPNIARVGNFTFFLLLAIVLMQGTMRLRKPRKLILIDYLIILQFIALFLGYRPQYGTDVWIWGFKQDSRYLVMFFLLRFIDFSIKDIRLFLRVILTLGLLMGGYAVVQYFFDYGRLLPFVAALNFLEAYGGEGSRAIAVKRAYSFILSPLNLGYAMMLGSMLSLVFATCKANTRFERKVAWAAFFAMCGGLLLSFTRSAWGGVLLGGPLLFMLKPYRKTIMWLGMIGLSIMFCVFAARPDVMDDFFLRFTSMFSTRAEENSWHYMFMLHSWQFILDHPLGAGLGTATSSASYFFGMALWTESEILNKGVQLGWFGLANFTVLLVVLTKKGLEIAKSQGTHPLIRSMGAYIFAATPACFLAGISGYVWSSWVSSSWFWMMSSIVITYYEIDKRERQKKAELALRNANSD